MHGGAVASALPENALLRRYGEGEQSALPYTDCFATWVEGECSLEDYVRAFYTSPLFRAERLVLRILARAPSTDRDLEALLQNRKQAFAVWKVEDRRPGQLLMRDRTGRTRSWFMVRRVAGESGSRLFFGSAVLPSVNAETLPLRLPGRVLMAAHRVYSRCLLAAARRGVERRRKAPAS